MGLGNVLSIANSGLGITEQSLSVVARNVANADSPGYTSKRMAQENIVSGNGSLGVRGLDVQRTVNKFVQSQLRSETSALGDVSVRNDFFMRIDQLFGDPGSGVSLDAVVNRFAQSLQEMTALSDDFSVRQAVVGDAQLLAQQLQQLSSDVQSLRQLAEDSIAVSVEEVNEALSQLSKINLNLGTGNGGADLLDERDKFIDKIAEHLDIRINEGPSGAVSIFTQSGNALLEGLPVQLVFDQRGNIGPQSLYNTDPAESGVGTISLRSDNGFAIDLIRNGILDSGRIGGLLELRDETLVELQSQLDELAHSLAFSFSSKTVEGTAVAGGPPDGFDVETNALLSGNTISLDYTQGGNSGTVTIVRVEDPSILPLSNDATSNPNDLVIGVSFSGGVGAAATALNTAFGNLGLALTASNPAGTTLRIVDDGGAATSDVNGLNATVTSTSVQDDGTQLPLFIDGGQSTTAYSGSLDFGGQKLGFAARITVNTQVVANNELLVRYASSPETPLGDTARAQELYNRLTSDPFGFSPSSGIGTAQSPFRGSIVDFAGRIVTLQTGRAEQTARELSAQDTVVTALQERFSADTAVDINTELTLLINLQNAYAANARIVQVVDELFNILFQAS